MTKKTTHSDALRAYLSLLEKNASKRADVSLKEHFARLLISNLQDHSVNHASYRTAVDSLLESLPGEYQVDAVHVAREFFPFLVSDVKAVVAMMKTGGYRGFSEGNAVVDDSNIKTMNDLITRSETQKYSAQQTAAYDKYLACLDSLGGEEKSIAKRGRIAKALLYLIRDKDVTPANYRLVIDSVLPMLTTEEARLYFVMVAREFYQFLTRNPNAAAMVYVS
jgi:hypothetical protein